LDVPWNKLERVDEKCLMRKCIICTWHHRSFDQIHDDELGNAYSRHG
jgi:hypothetical protein